ncbi:MAG: YesL family protein [Oscillospiraceae bacterium]|nr:YesL family protein [Oscillospiraceae bacterium]
MNLAANLILLNLLWFLCSLPIVTMGASTCALYSAVIRCWNDTDNTVLGDFFGAFKENFKRGTGAWLIFLLLSLVLYGDIDISINGFRGTPFSALWIPAALALVVLVCTAIYAFPMLVRYDDNLKTTLRNSISLAIGRPFYTLTLLILTVLCVLATYISFPACIIVWALFGGSALTSVNYRIFRVVFQELEHPEEAAQAKKERKKK